MEDMGRKIKLIFLPCKENSYRAYLLRPSVLFSLVFLFLIIKILVLPLYFYFPKSAFFAKVVSSELIGLLNEQRENMGLSPLRENLLLTRAAEMKAKDMIEKGYFSHKDPGGDGQPLRYRVYRT